MTTGTGVRTGPGHLVLVGWMGPWGLVAVVVAALADPAAAYQFGSARWSSTATDGSGLGQGDPTTITWGFVADDTTIVGNEGTSPSNLIAFLDELYGDNGGGADLTQRPWFSLFRDSFDRWGELSGLTHVYQPDNPSYPYRIDNTPVPYGQLGSIPDIRIGGHSIDGQDGSNTLAYNYYPQHGDMVLDTDNTDFFGDTAYGSRRLRNTVMHEHGHGLGLAHVESDNASFLMEAFIGAAFDGPQLDDIVAVQRLYGDVLEKEGGGNDSHGTATPLYLLTADAPLAVGTDADNTFVAAPDTDFVSIDDDSDHDFFSFTVEQAAPLTVTLTPKGPTYNQGPETEPPTPQTPFNSSAQSDLALALFDTDGTTLLWRAADTLAGEAEAIIDFLLEDAGTYYVSVTGGADTAQLYRLDLSVEDLLLFGDVNLDGLLNGLDVQPFVNRLVDGLFQAEADVNQDGLVNGLDVHPFLDAVLSGGASGLQAVPEPPMGVLAAVALSGIAAGRRRESMAGTWLADRRSTAV